MPIEFKSKIKYVYQILNRPIEELKKLGFGNGVESVQEGTGIDIDNTDPSNPIINVIGDGTSTLQSVTDIDNTTTNNIVFSGNSTGLLFDNGSKVQKGTTDSGNGGNKGVAQVCSINYELKWEAGRLYYMEQDGFTIRDVTHNFTFVPQPTDDQTKGFIVGSRWSLDDGTIYVCKDDSVGAAVWNILLKAEECIPLSGTQSNSVSGTVSFDVTSGGASQYTYANGDIITFGVDYGGYSAISFYDATANETIYLYLRGGDLYLDNIDAGTSAGNLIGSITDLKANKAGYVQIAVDNQGHNGLLGIINAPILNPNNFYGTDVIGRKGWLRLPAYWARHCAFVTQSGTNAPTEVVVETDLNGVAVGGTQNYNWTRVSAGHYRLTINTGIGGWDFTNTIPVARINNGNVNHVVYSTTLGTTTATTLVIDIKSFNSTNGTLGDDLMTRTLVEVELYG